MSQFKSKTMFLQRPSLFKIALLLSYRLQYKLILFEYKIQDKT